MPAAVRLTRQPIPRREVGAVSSLEALRLPLYQNVRSRSIDVLRCAVLRDVFTKYRSS